ncbi:MAG: protocatechuate 3,4-dioxygenase [Amphritea sp.]|nr:protocatechuate 3,4-dioxygenase [Amphritea sp.]
MVWLKHDYDDIPGTYVFDGERAHSSYALNKLFYSFNKAECRDEFNADPAAYCDKFCLNENQKKLVVEQQFLNILRAGTNIYYMAKFCIPRGVSVQDAGAAFQGISGDEFREKLLKKREDLEQRLEREGGYWNG